MRRGSLCSICGSVSEKIVLLRLRHFDVIAAAPWSIYTDRGRLHAAEKLFLDSAVPDCSRDLEGLIARRERESTIVRLTNGKDVERRW